MLSEMLEECRWLYNQTLSMRKEACEEEQQHIGWYETKRMIPIYKKTIRPTLSKVHSQVLQNVTERIELAFQAFFRRLKAGEKPGYPRFKGHGRYNSLTYPQSGFCLAGQWLDVSKIGRIWVVLHRPVGGKVKTCTIRRSSTGKWYVCFSCEVEAEPALPAEQKAVGVDVGLEHFATLSTGKHIPNPG
jgi:putative transposase